MDSFQDQMDEWLGRLQREQSLAERKVLARRASEVLARSLRARVKRGELSESGGELLWSRWLARVGPLLPDAPPEKIQRRFAVTKRATARRIDDDGPPARSGGAA